MKMSEKEFREMLESNPNIRVEQTNKKTKYRNIKVYVYSDDRVSHGEKRPDWGTPLMVFDSTKEYKRWGELKLLEKAGEIQNLKRQTTLIIQKAFVYHTEKIRAIVYKADFQYVRKGIEVIEDVKPYDKRTGKYRLTKDFALKWKLLKAKYPEKMFEIY